MQPDQPATTEGKDEQAPATVVKLDASLLASKLKAAPKAARPKKKANDARAQAKRDGTPARRTAARPRSTPPKERTVYDLTTTQGRRNHLIQLAKSTKDADALRALKELEASYASDKDPDSKLDPAEVCAFIVRHQLYGEDPATVLLQKRGVRTVMQAMADGFGIDAIHARVGEEVVCIGELHPAQIDEEPSE